MIRRDFLDGDAAQIQVKLLGKGNDDILWPAQALIAVSEIYGANTVEPVTGIPGKLWWNGTQKTVDETWAEWSEECGGGIYWVS